MVGFIRWLRLRRRRPPTEYGLPHMIGVALDDYCATHPGVGTMEVLAALIEVERAIVEDAVPEEN